MEKFMRTKLATWQLPIKMQIQHYIDIAKESGHNLPRQEARKMVNESKKQEIWINDKYQVNILRGKDCDQYVHIKEYKGKCDYLSIKTLDKEPIHDWRDFQQIKNELCGEDREALEIYPMEERLVDTANQYHLWVLPKNAGVPFGFMEREVNYQEREGDFNSIGQRGKDEN